MANGSKSVDVKKGEGKVSVKHPDKSETEHTEEVTENRFSEPTANVGVSFAVTKNLGNYESLKVQVSVNLPCFVEEIDEVHAFAKKWVNRKMELTVDELMSDDT